MHSNSKFRTGFPVDQKPLSVNQSDLRNTEGKNGISRARRQGNPLYKATDKFMDESLKN